VRLTRFTEIVEAANRDDARKLATESAARIVVIERHGPRAVVFQCPCGCGETMVVNVDPALKRAWRVRRDHRGLTLLPSVWRTSGCESHFVLWENRVWWCDFRDPDRVTELPERDDWPEELTRYFLRETRRECRWDDE
jgi:hypothetical protein